MAEKTGDQCGVYLVPAFTGLGAPYWDPKARGAIFGLTRDTGIAEIVTAGLQSVCFQTRDLLDAMTADGASSTAALRVDGGMVVNNWVVQALANILGVPVDRPQVTETTALGVAYLAGLQVGLYRDLAEIAAHWQRERAFEPAMPEAKRNELYEGWLDAIRRVRD
jgi:glycerol kinase